MATQGLLHKDAYLGGNSLEYWLSLGIKESNDFIFDVYKLIIGGSLSICEELSMILLQITESKRFVLFARYGLENKTLDAVGREAGVTRERIRQIGARLEEMIPVKFMSLASNLHIQTALLIARDMGYEITYDKWKAAITQSGLVGNWENRENYHIDPVEALISICKVSIESKLSELNLPENLRQSLELAADGKTTIPARLMRLKATLPKEKRKLITRHLRFSGAVNAKWLSQELKIDVNQTKDILDVLNLHLLIDDWYIPKTEDKEITNHHVFHQSVRKMFQYCGPLNVEDLGSGLRHVISRHSLYPVPPPNVMQQVLLAYHYRCEDNLFYWEGNSDAELSASEQHIWQTMKTHGGVAHHAELAQVFLDNNLSLPALSATLRHSPLFTSLRKGIYKLRGNSVTPQSIARAEVAGKEWTPVNVEVSYTRSGNIEICATLGILAVATGVIMSKQLPDLSGEWRCFVEEQELRVLRAVQGEFRVPRRAFDHLDCHVGDRVKFIFNTFQRTVQITKAMDSSE